MPSMMLRIDLDLAPITKIFGKVAVAPAASMTYSAARIMGMTTEVIRGNPHSKHISTFRSRQNMTTRC
jgi:hypothetical protein